MGQGRALGANHAINLCANPAKINMTKNCARKPDKFNEISNVSPDLTLAHTTPCGHKLRGVVA